MCERVANAQTTAEGWSESLASGGLSGRFDQHRPIDTQQRGRPLYSLDRLLDRWRPRSDLKRLVRAR